MKRILILSMLVAAFAACTKYEYNDSFTSPTELSGTEQVAIDLANQQAIVLSWTGGGAEDGSPVLYDVLFDQAGGDFSAPFYKQKSDMGTHAQLTLTHALLNAIARDGGVDPTGSGDFIWTVRASKGGVMKLASQSKPMSLTRPDALDLPASLYIFGSALESENVGMEMRVIDGSKGIFFGAVTFASAGDVWFCDKADPESPGAIKYYYDTVGGKLMQGEGSTQITEFGYEMDLTLDLSARTYVAVEHFDVPAALYIQGSVAEAGQQFRRAADDTFILYTKFSGAGEVWFTTTADPDDENSVPYYIDEGRLVLGEGTTPVAATRYNADRVTVNTTTRTMTVEPIGEIVLEWVNAMKPVDEFNPAFVYSSNGNFTLALTIPANFEHVDEENKGTDPNVLIDARYTLKVNEDPANPMPMTTEELAALKTVPAAQRKIMRWGCKYTWDTKDQTGNGLPYNMTVAPYSRNRTADPKISHAAYWVPVFDSGELDGAPVNTEEIVITPYYVYSEMPNRWNANFYFKTELAGTMTTATIYTNRNNVMGVAFQ